ASLHERFGISEAGAPEPQPVAVDPPAGRHRRADEHPAAPAGFNGDRSTRTAATVSHRA
ncbi:MAG: hypothetical protein QOJ61_756, partial [Mycobacterium sp.]|nr:hypothetical protein [Mycobacterium sp.]